jgi:hypothetical protein
MIEIIGYEDFNPLDESEKYSSTGGNIKKTWAGEYILRVDDYLKTKSKPLKGSILVGKDSGKAIALTYLNPDGSEAKYLWVPYFGSYINRNSEGGISNIKITPYKNWLSQEENEKKLEDFLEGFIDSIEKEKSESEKMISLQAQKDLDLILDMYNINSNIDKFEKIGNSNEWKAYLENGFEVVIKKRSSEDLVGEFRIYPNNKSEVPCIEINTETNNEGFTFRRKGEDRIRRRVSMTSLGKDPVALYLFKNIIGDQEYSDEKSLLEYFKRIVKSEDKNYQSSDDPKSYRKGREEREEIDLVSKLLEDFLTSKKIEEIYNESKKS